LFPKFPKVEGLPKLLLFPNDELLLFPKVVPPPKLFDELLLLFPNELFVLPKVELVEDPKPKVFVDGEEVLFNPNENVFPEELLLLVLPKVVKA